VIMRGFEGVWGRILLSKKVRLGLLLLMGGASLLPTPVRAAGAVYDIPPYNNPICNCCVLPGEVMREMLTGTVLWTGQPDLHHWYIETLYYTKIEPAFMRMADQMVKNVTNQARAIGTFYDAQNQLTAQRSLQRTNAESQSHYSTSEALCKYASLSTSLAASEAKQNAVRLGILERSQNRQLMSSNMNPASSAEAGRTLGQSADKAGRMSQFLAKFCDPNDSDAAFAGMCASSQDTQINRDIDLTRTIDAPLTLDVNFTSGGGAPTVDEENVMALANNLYAHDLALNVGNSDFKSMASASNANEGIKDLQDFRSAVAKRSVAENSFAAIAAMKAAGTGGSTPYLKSVLAELGISAADADKLIGTNPSYYAQMDILGRKLYQTPAFYANLMDSPDNVARQSAALKSISLMQQRDIYESMQRSEMLLSTLLEMYIVQEQDKMTNEGVK
jgi:hypothetical protein